jgi:hypothetical protein
VAIRIEILSGGSIELLRTCINTGRVKRTIHEDVKMALSAFYYCFKREIEREREERFTPALDIECKKLLKLKLEERTHGKKR